mmetsp:Transcript_18532/g.30220  ORF Transcript_18532/g.30220 Transcript_18532/m.30220 type:complete len:310 (+) Transcript_18532:20-949(+)
MKPTKVRHNAGDQVAAMLNPVRGYRDAQRRAGVEPVDYGRRNLRELREKQRLVQEQRLEQHKSAPAVPFKMKKFQGVESRLTKQQQRDEDEAKTHKFLKKGERCNVKLGHAAGNGGKQQPQRRPRKSNNGPMSPEHDGDDQGCALKIRTVKKDAVPRANDLNTLAPRSSKNFVHSNAVDVLAKDTENKQKEMMRREQDNAKAKAHSNYGQVPKYLLKRQSELLREKVRREEALDPDCPPGMVRISEQERKATLEALRTSVLQTQNDLRKFPLTVSSMAQRKRKAQLEETLAEQEAAIALMSKENVYLHE